MKRMHASIKPVLMLTLTLATAGCLFDSDKKDDEKKGITLGGISTQGQIDKTWSEGGTNGRSDIGGLSFPDNTLPSKMMWSRIIIEMSMSAANGDVEISLNGQNIKSYGIDTDQWQNKTDTLQVNGLGDLVVTGHISKKNWNELARGSVKVTAQYVLFPKPDSKNNIIFAHGMNSNNATWDVFARHAESKGYRVFRTDVEGCGSIAARAEQLATYIIGQDIADGTLIAVGHSMGGSISDTSSE